MVHNTEREIPDGRDSSTDKLMRYLIEQTGADVVIDHAPRNNGRVHIGYYAEDSKVQGTALSIVQNEGMRVIHAGANTTTADPELPHVEAVGRYDPDDGKTRGWFEARTPVDGDTELTVPEDY